MTMRTFAAAILKAALRLATPLNREWGQAMLRELDYVEGDWATLWWALGAIVALFRPMRAPLRSVQDVASRAVALHGEVRKRSLIGNLASLIVVAGFGFYIYVFPNPVQRTGSILTVAAALYMMFQLVQARSGRISTEEDADARIGSYRKELERQRDFHWGYRFWLRGLALFPGYMLFCWGFAIAHPEVVPQMKFAVAIFVVIAATAVPGNLRLARKYQRQLDELDAFWKKLK